MTRAAPLALLAGLALGCAESPVSCPGDSQAALSFGGAVPATDPPATDCRTLIPAGATTSFPATVSFTSDATAALCLNRPLTEPRACQRAGDQLAGCASPPQELTLAGCACPLVVQETLAGQLQRAGTRVTGFTGTLVVTLSRSATPGSAACWAAEDARAGSACPPAGGCSARYDLTGAP